MPRAVRPAKAGLIDSRPSPRRSGSDGRGSGAQSDRDGGHGDGSAVTGELADRVIRTTATRTANGARGARRDGRRRLAGAVIGEATGMVADRAPTKGVAGPAGVDPVTGAAARAIDGAMADALRRAGFTGSGERRRGTDPAGRSPGARGRPAPRCPGGASHAPSRVRRWCAPARCRGSGGRRDLDSGVVGGRRRLSSRWSAPASPRTATSAFTWPGSQARPAGVPRSSHSPPSSACRCIVRPGGNAPTMSSCTNGRISSHSSMPAAATSGDRDRLAQRERLVGDVHDQFVQHPLQPPLRPGPRGGPGPDPGSTGRPSGPRRPARPRPPAARPAAPPGRPAPAGPGVPAAHRRGRAGRHDRGHPPERVSDVPGELDQRPFRRSSAPACRIGTLQQRGELPGPRGHLLAEPLGRQHAANRTPGSPFVP